MTVHFGRFKCVFVGIALAVSACTAAVAPQRSDQEIVAAKSKQRWTALIAGDFKSAYDVISPAGRSVISAEGYKNTLKSGFWKDAQVKQVNCASPELCEVTLEIEYEYVGRRTRTPLAEKWIKQDGNWWYLLEK